MPTIVTVIAVGLAVFALGLASSIARAQSHDAWQETGADYRLEAGPRDGAALDRVLRAGIAGIEATALVAVIPGTRFARADQTYQTISLVAVQPDAHARVVRATPAERHFPAAFGAGPTGDGASVPVLASAGFLSAQGVQVGDTILLEPGNVDLHATIAGTIADFPGVTDQQVVLVAYDDLAALTAQNGATLQPTMLFIRGQAGLGDALRVAAGDLTAPDDFSILARSDVLASSRDSAFSLGISDGFRLTVLVATLLAALAIIVVQALSLAAHRRDFGYLRTLGLSTRQAFALSLVEHLPITIIAGVVGALLGAGLVHLIEPGLPLEGFTTQGAAIDPAVPLWPAVALTAAILFVVLVALLAFTLATWRTQFERLARAGD
jgi:putative ABC transport system permease protein